jgi:hypothetical protein
MRKFLIILIGILALMLAGSLVVAQGKPRSDKIQAPEIEMGVFVDYGYSSPLWYPPDCGDPQYETDRYQRGPRIYWASEYLPVDITVYTGDQPVSGTFEAIKAGFTTWDLKTGTSLYSTESATTTGPGVTLDDENTVQWGLIDGPGGIIGATYYWYWANTKEMVEFDIILDKEETWATGGTSTAFDVQNVATHEAGHTLVLGDIRSPKSCGLTMHAYTWLGDTLKRSLGTGDILGVRAIYGE